MGGRDGELESSQCHRARKVVLSFHDCFNM
jgi:hypothetical protein